MLVSFNSGEPRRLGAEGGADDAISVSIITAKDLDGRATIEDRAAGSSRAQRSARTDRNAGASRATATRTASRGHAAGRHDATGTHRDRDPASARRRRTRH